MSQPPATIDLVFHALGDPTRRIIVMKLSHGPLSVSQFATPLAITLTAVTQHLQVLEQSGLVRTNKIGRARTCHIQASGFSALEKRIQECRSLGERGVQRAGDRPTELDKRE